MQPLEKKKQIIIRILSKSQVGAAKQRRNEDGDSVTVKTNGG